MQRRGEFRVSVTKDYLVFASAHFITFPGIAAKVCTDTTTVWP